MQILAGDCLEVLKTLPDNSVDSVCCDPPYHLTSVVKRFGKEGSAPAQFGNDGAFARASRGFMSKAWDGGDIAFRPETWAAVLRVLKPGGYIVAFASTRGFGRMQVAMEDAGFITHPMLIWAFGSGMPKATQTKIPELAGWRYGGQALKPAVEPIYMGQKPFSEKTGTANIRRWGAGAINIDACRITSDGPSPTAQRRESARRNDTDYTGGGVKSSETDAQGKLQRRGDPETFKRERPSEQLGRWPANLIHDGSDEVISCFPVAPGQIANASTSDKPRNGQSIYGAMARGNGRAGEASADKRYPESGSTNFAVTPGMRRADSGSAARFFTACPYDTEEEVQRLFYCAKANKTDRAGSLHPTVKPIALVKWLTRLITPSGGIVLDPFAGTGTTGQAALEQGFNVVLIEREAEYLADIRRRLKKYLPEETDLTPAPVSDTMPTEEDLLADLLG